MLPSLRQRIQWLCGPYHHPQDNQGGQDEHPRRAGETLVEGTGWEVQVRMRRRGSCRPSSTVPQADVRATASGRSQQEHTLCCSHAPIRHHASYRHPLMGLLHVHGILHGREDLGGRGCERLLVRIRLRYDDAWFLGCDRSHARCERTPKLSQTVTPTSLLISTLQLYTSVVGTRR
jgi:hypothetical protein